MTPAEIQQLKECITFRSSQEAKADIVERDEALVARSQAIEQETGKKFIHIGPDLEMFRVRCGLCLKEQPEGEHFRACAGCRSVVYCSRVCQTGHWGAVHKRLCRKAAARVNQ